MARTVTRFRPARFGYGMVAVTVARPAHRAPSRRPSGRTVRVVACAVAYAVALTLGTATAGQGADAPRCAEFNTCTVDVSHVDILTRP